MKKLLLAIILCTGFAASVFGQSVPPTKWQELDGSPSVTSPTVIKFPNGTLTISGKTVTYTPPGGGGGGITIGTTTITSGTNTRILYNNAGVVGEYTVTGSGNAVLSASPTLTGTVAMAAQTNSGTITQTSNSATAFESGPNGGTNPVFRLVNSTASQADGVSITGLAAGSGVTFTALSGGSNAPITLTPKGTGIVGIAGGSGTFIAMSSGGTFGQITDNGATNGLWFSNTGKLGIRNANYGLASDALITWTNTAGNFYNATVDTTLRRGSAAASIVQGAANSAAPVANLFTIGESSRGGTDSNVAGANGTVQSGLGTGTGTLSTLILRSPIAAASGTTAQTYATGLTVVGGTAKMTSYTVATLPAAATVGAGARAFVTDALTPVFGSAVTGGGAVGVPVYSDGSTWLVG